MTNSKEKDPLLSWNQANKNNAEQDFVSAMYKSITETTAAVDKFSMWLLAGTGATGALLISQVASILPYLSAKGFKVCMLLIVISAILGFLAKYKALRCEMQNQMQSSLQELLEPIFTKHEKNEEEISKLAEQRGIEIETDIDFQNVISEFSIPLPWWAKLLLAREVKKVESAEGDNRQAGYHVAFRAYMGQMQWTFFQSFFYLAFMLSGAYYANTI